MLCFGLGVCASGSIVVSCFFFSSRRRHTRLVSDWSSDVCSSDLMGFEKEVKQILNQVPQDRQTLMFSATIPSSIEAMALKYQRETERLMLSQDALSVTGVQHLFCILSRMDKAAALYRLIEYETPASSMIFCNTKAETRLVHSYLALRGLPVAMISSDLPQKKREQVMRRFRKKELKHLVATDVAARGIDIEDLSHVFIYSTHSSSV